MKNWSAGYEMLRMYVRFAFWLTHQRIIVTGRQWIPKGKPIIFAANHQNALMDPLALACTNPYQSVWLARADIFKSKTASSILKYLKLLPVYRIRDGKENLSNNEHIFEQVIHLLENRKTIALFPEAAHSGKRKMLPHKKAVPRIALEAEEKNDFRLDIRIVPVGIYYSHYWHFNRALIVQYGKPIEVEKYRDEYAESPQKAMTSLRDEIYNRICPLTLQINSEKYYQEYENIGQLAGNAYSKIRFFNRDSRLQLFYAEKELIFKVEQIENNQPESFEKLIKETTEYFDALKKAGLSDDQVRKAGEARFSLLLIQLLAAFLSLPLFVFGFAFNALPLFVPRMILRSKVKDITFLSTFNFVAGLIVFPLFYLITASLLLVVTRSLTISFISFMLMPFAGKYAYQLLVFYRDIFQEFAFFAAGKSRRKQIKQMVSLRNKQINSILEKLNF